MNETVQPKPIHDLIADQEFEAKVMKAAKEPIAALSRAASASARQRRRLHARTVVLTEIDVVHDGHWIHHIAR
jgi:hypothetical protein